MVARGDNHLIELMNRYMEDLNEEVLLQEIMKIVRPSRQKPGVIIPTKNANDDISSPLGTFLHEKKKRQMAEHELKLSLQNTEIKSIIETHDEEIHLGFN